jgi:hypothetical protein
MKCELMNGTDEAGWMNKRMAMKTQEEPAGREEEFSLPADLGEWAAPCTLMEWIEEEVERLDWKNPEVVEYLRLHPDYRPKAMLCLLAYAYASQVFGSEEIVRRCYNDTVYRLLCEGKAPQAQQLIRFRRENRGLIKGILTYVFIRAVREQFELGTVLLPPGLKRYLLDNAVERLNTARHMDSMEE